MKMLTVMEILKMQLHCRIIFSPCPEGWWGAPLSKTPTQSMYKQPLPPMWAFVPKCTPLQSSLASIAHSDSILLETPQKSLSLSLFLQSSISASTPLLPRLKRSIIIMYANSGVQSMAWVVYASYSSLLPLLGLTPRIWTCTPDRTEFGVRSRSIAEARTEGM